MRVEVEEEDVAADAAAFDTTVSSSMTMAGTGINSAKDTDAITDTITDAITMAVCTTPLHMITTTITTEQPATIMVEIAFMTIIMIGVIVTN